MTQPQQVLPGGPASTPVSSEATEREANIRQAVDLIGQLARRLPHNVSQEQNDKDRREAEDTLVSLGICQGMFGSLILSYNQSGPAGIRAFMERHFSEWDGEAAQLQS
ncbi:MAG: hypothetical protein ACYC1K_02580 [Minisyncoccota bacterium]